MVGSVPVHGLRECDRAAWRDERSSRSHIHLRPIDDWDAPTSEGAPVLGSIVVRLDRYPGDEHGPQVVVSPPGFLARLIGDSLGSRVARATWRVRDEAERRDARVRAAHAATRVERVPLVYFGEGDR